MLKQPAYHLHRTLGTVPYRTMQRHSTPAPALDPIQRVDIKPEAQLQQMLQHVDTAGSSGRVQRGSGVERRRARCGVVEGGAGVKVGVWVGSGKVLVPAGRAAARRGARVEEIAGDGLVLDGVSKTRRDGKGMGRRWRIWCKDGTI